MIRPGSIRTSSLSREEKLLTFERYEEFLDKVYGKPFDDDDDLGSSMVVVERPLENSKRRR